MIVLILVVAFNMFFAGAVWVQEEKDLKATLIVALFGFLLIPPIYFNDLVDAILRKKN